MESQVLRVKRTKADYMECLQQAERTVNIGNADLVKAEKLKYVGSVLNQNGGCQDDFKARVQSGWTKFQEMSRVLADKRISKN